MATNVTTNETDVISGASLTVIKTFTILATALGSTGNALTIFAILKGNFHKNPCYLFVLNLNICNLIHCLVFNPIIAIQAFRGIWSSASAQCTAFSFGLFVNLGTELWGYTYISINRYFCVVHFGLYSALYGKSKYLVFQLVFSWLFYPVVFLLPVFRLWSQYRYVPRKLICVPFEGRNCDGFCLFVFIIALVTTFPVILFCYTAIIYTYIKSRRNAGQKFSRENSASNSTVSNLRTNLTENIVKSDRERQKRRSELKMAFTILCVILVFGTCRLPFMILYLYDPSMTKTKPIVHIILKYFGSCSNWINPIVYSMTNDQIRTTLKNNLLFYCEKKSVDLNVGIPIIKKKSRYIWNELKHTKLDFVHMFSHVIYFCGCY